MILTTRRKPRVMAPPAAKPKTVRADLGEVIGQVFSKEWLFELAQSVKGATTGVWGAGQCPDCGSQRKVLVQIPDIKGQLAAVTELLEQAEGRPGVQSGDPAGVTIVVERKWPPDDEQAADDSRRPAA
jgi:hypothetical protein